MNFKRKNNTNRSLRKKRDVPSQYAVPKTIKKELELKKTKNY